MRNQRIPSTETSGPLSIGEATPQSRVKGGYSSSHLDERHARSYAELYSQRSYWRLLWEFVEKPLLKRELQRRRSAGARRFLDFATGTGRVLAVGEEFFEFAVGLDVSWAMLQIARRKVGPGRLVCGSVECLSTGGNLDVVTAFRFFLNADAALREMTLDALREALVSNGALIFNLHVLPWSITGLWHLGRRAVGLAAQNVVDPASFFGLLETKGFAVRRCFWYGVLPFRGTVGPETFQRWGQWEAARVSEGRSHRMGRQAVLVVAERR